MTSATEFIDRNRLAQTFEALVRIDSVSREEGKVAEWLSARLDSLGARVQQDKAGEAVGGECGNIVACIPGDAKTAPLMLSAHMDTVEPGRGIRPVLRDGVFSSDGRTILGADDKSALAIILEVLQCLKERGVRHGPLEVVFSICEEVGLLGAKNLDLSLISARTGYVLDTRNPGAIITRAPSANRISFEVHGKAAHAGSAPEKGINAIWLAAKAIASLKLGRIDEETTCNLGLIEGGLATNIVPSRVIVHGEARSHDEAKLAHVTQTIVEAFRSAVAEHSAAPGNTRPWVDVDVQRDFDRLSIPDGHPVAQTAMQAAADLGLSLETAASGGGSDANVFAGRGIITGILGTGMENVHTVHETVRMEDMARSARLLLRIIERHAGA